MLEIGKNIYNIDEVNHPYEVIREEPKGYFYVALFHPSFRDIKHIKEEDMGKTFFSTRDGCYDARIKRAERKLKQELSCREKNI
jgi:hypothetical protein